MTTHRMADVLLAELHHFLVAVPLWAGILHGFLHKKSIIHHPLASTFLKHIIHWHPHFCCTSSTGIRISTAYHPLASTFLQHIIHWHPHFCSTSSTGIHISAAHHPLASTFLQHIIHWHPHFCSTSSTGIHISAAYHPLASTFSQHTKSNLSSANIHIFTTQKVIIQHSPSSTFFSTQKVNSPLSADMHIILFQNEMIFFLSGNLGSSFPSACTNTYSQELAKAHAKNSPTLNQESVAQNKESACS